MRLRMWATAALLALAALNYTPARAGDHVQVGKDTPPGSAEDVISKWRPGLKPQGATAPTTEGEQQPPAETTSEFVAHWLADNVEGFGFLHPPAAGQVTHGTHVFWKQHTEEIIDLARRYKDDPVVTDLLTQHILPVLDEVKKANAFDETAYTDPYHPVQPQVHHLNEALAEVVDRLRHIEVNDADVRSLTREVVTEMSNPLNLAKICGNEGQYILWKKPPELPSSTGQLTPKRPPTVSLPLLGGFLLGAGLLATVVWRRHRHVSV